jgi:hypothetical protein
MSEKVTVELPEELAQRARALASQARRGFEEVLVEWIDRAVAEPAVEFLPDDQVLALCDGRMDADQQEELSGLLARNREGHLAVGERDQLDALMGIYRRGLVRKAQAWKVAVARGLKPRLGK